MSWGRSGGGFLSFAVLSAQRWRAAFFLCSRVGRHIPLALLSGPFPAAGGFCQPHPHCWNFLCSLALTMAFFCLLIYMCTFCPCVFCLFCSAVCCVFLWSRCRAGAQPMLSLCCSTCLSIHLSPTIHCHTAVVLGSYRRRSRS